MNGFENKICLIPFVRLCLKLMCLCLEGFWLLKTFLIESNININVVNMIGCDVPSLGSSKISPEGTSKGIKKK